MKDCTNIYPAWLQCARIDSIWTSEWIGLKCYTRYCYYRWWLWISAEKSLSERSLHFNILTDFVEENVFARTGWNQYICATNKIKQNRYLDGEWDNVVIFIPRRNEYVSVLPVIFHSVGRQASRISVPKWLHNWFKCTGLCPHFD